MESKEERSKRRKYGKFYLLYFLLTFEASYLGFGGEPKSQRSPPFRFIFSFLFLFLIYPGRLYVMRFRF